MNERQRKFCELYAADPNATRAAKAAGYSPATAYSIGQRLLKKVETKKYLAELTAMVKSERICNITEVLEYLTAVMRNPEERTSDRTRAAALLCEMLTDTDSKDDELHIVVDHRVVDLSKDKMGFPSFPKP